MLRADCSFRDHWDRVESITVEKGNWGKGAWNKLDEFLPEASPLKAEEKYPQGQVAEGSRIALSSKQKKG